MKGFALLYGKILDSSLWVKESKETRLVWVTLMAMKDEEGRIYASVVGLADRAKVSASECREALKVLLSEDADDSSGVEEGRRLRVIPGGWEIVNNELYRYSTDERREFWRRTKAEQRSAKATKALAKEEEREKKKLEALKRGTESMKEKMYRKASENGDTATMDRLTRTSAQEGNGAADQDSRSPL